MADKRSIKSYTTTVAVSKTVSDVTKLLVERGAQRVVTIYEDGSATGIAFLLDTEFGPREYTIPTKVDGVLAAILNDTNIPKAQRTKEKASRIAWRIALSWLETQFALIDAEMSTVSEVMLPYMVSGPGGETVYEVYRRKQLEIES